MLESLPEPDWGDARSLYLLTRARIAAQIGGQSRHLLRHATRAAESYRLLRQIDSAWRKWAKRDGAELKPLRIAFAGTVTTDFLFPALRAYLFADGLSPEIWNAPFGQYQQAILGRRPRAARVQARSYSLRHRLAQRCAGEFARRACQ